MKNSMSTKLRKDSTWSRLTSAQRAKLEKWLFEGNLSYAEAVARAHKERRPSRSSILERVQGRGRRRKRTPQMARERPKPKPCEERMPTRLDDGAVGVRRPEAEGGRHSGASHAAAKESGEPNNVRLCSLMFAYVRLTGKKILRMLRTGQLGTPFRYP